MSSAGFDAAATKPSPTVPYSHKGSLTPPSSKCSMKDKKQARSCDRESGSREITPTVKSSAMAKSDSVLAGLFKSDLTHIKSIVTCSICDQLLYEPYTLACGHTYCYSCLCNWFLPNRRKKSCPECRARVKVLPTQSYLVKSIVEVFTKQTELMPLDENPEQHAKRRAEEIAEVEKDRNSPEGLFKGTFPKTHGGRLWMDEADGVMRCPACGHEHEGGPSCQVCGEQFDDDDRYDFSDYDDDDLDAEEDLENLEIDLDADEVNAEFAHMHGHHHFLDHFDLPNMAHYANHFQHPQMQRFGEATDPSVSDGSEVTTDSEDDLDGFVVPDDEEPIPLSGRRRARNGAAQVQTITISDDESDEGGEISNGRSRRRRGAGASIPLPAVPDALSISDDSTHESDFDESLSEAEHRLQNAGWSPLNNGNETEVEAHPPYHYGYGGYSTTDDEHDEDGSDTTTETLGGNAVNYHEEEDESRDDLSETPTPYDEGYNIGASPDYGDIYHAQYQYLGEEEDDEVVNGATTGTDGDGDTNMSPSPSRDTPNPYAVNYNEDYQGRGDRGVSLSTDYDYDRHPDDLSNYGYDVPAEHTYVANAVHDIEEESSDSSIRPPPRRQPRQPRQYRHPDHEAVQIIHHHNNPFAGGSRARVEGSRSYPIFVDGAGDDWEGEVRRIIEPSSRDRRMTAYRSMPTRHVDPLRSSRSPSAARIISSSNRVSRVPRQYSRRN